MVVARRGRMVFGARAQDVILLRNAEEIRAEVREVTDTHLIYRLWDGPDEVLMLPRSEVFFRNIPATVRRTFS